MNWIIASLIMFFGSVGLYLVVRKSSLKKMPTQFNNLAMFLVPLVLYLGIGLTTKSDYTISPLNLLIIFATALFFSYLANVSSLKSIEQAPNPGYSLVISKSYVVFTTIFSFIFLSGDLSVKKVIAILIIVLFSILVVVDPKKTVKSKGTSWIIYTLYSFFGWGFLSLLIKMLVSRGVSVIILLTYMYTFVSMFILIEILLKKIKISLPGSLPYFVGIGLFSSIFNYFNFYAVSIAPNVGYVNAINASSISMVTIFSVLFFKDELSYRKLTGVVGVTLGLLLLLIK